MQTIYKILFEVKVLHEFYLTNPKGDSIFDLDNQADRLVFLIDRRDKDAPAVNSDISFEVPSALNQLFRDHHLRLLPSYSGCKVGIEVTASFLPDGTRVYTPKIPLPADLPVTILLRVKNPGFHTITNSRIVNPVPATYYFSNDSVLSALNFPALSSRIADFTAGYAYEQGELATIAPNSVKAYYIDNNADKWLPLHGNDYVNEGDRCLLPLRFNFTFPAGANVTQATFTLKDSGGNVVNTFVAQNAGGLQKVALNYSDLSLVNYIKYSLEVAGDNSFAWQHAVIFSDTNSWATLQFKPRVTNAAFNLLDDQGYLITRKPPVGNINDPPVFELRIPSRLTYWRYVHANRLPFDQTNYPDELLNYQNGSLISKSPRNSTYQSTYFQKPDNSFFFLPNPEDYGMIRSENKQLFTEIMLPTSKLFPVAP
ncbi:MULTISPECIES: hypothetical protein [unclassified Chitinophaga]|uniref:hypothetical protein n=1 Tax=unclassified Chitinophaga TaxID=2619133 RepID=UPI0009CBC935|nr:MULTISPECIES: hypothetical protein [unclassified Chitinophaga]OMP79722.1 hypothetical protein BW716_08365 [[Flexibacter] sp. ATCC 35208]WPV66621.1 hypothetical protein QQL36_33030 [Chitinophaga sp. LS1]